jgi:excisionase family DNA binding protein
LLSPNSSDEQGDYSMSFDTNFNPITMSISSAAQYLSLGRTTIRKLIGDGHLESIKIGRRRLVTTKSLVAFVSESRGSLRSEHG